MRTVKTKTKPAAPQQKAVPAPSRKPFDLHMLAMGGVILFISLLRFNLLEVPLERDEGEYAYMGQLILDGFAPYQHAYNMKLPGTYFMYALMMAVFGETPFGIHLGLLLVNAGTMAFLFLAFRRMFHPSIALFAASVYGLMALSPAFMGFAAHATHFVTFFMAIGLYFFSFYLRNQKNTPLFLSGIFFGLSFLMKQQAVFFLLFGGIMVILNVALKKPVSYAAIIRQGLLYSAGAVLPYLLTIAGLYAAGAFDRFWFWTVEYAGKYASGLSLKEGRATFQESFQPMWKEFTLFWWLLLAGLMATFLTRQPLLYKLGAVLFALFAFLTVCPGFYFRQHYFISFLPAVGLMGGITLHYISVEAAALMKWRSLSFLSFFVFLIALFVVLPQKKEYYLSPESEAVSRQVYGLNPFVESPVIGAYIKDHSESGDQVAVMGSEPQIYFYAGRKAATGHIYTYGLMEEQPFNKKMQEEMISEIEKNKPRFLLVVNIGTSWLRRENSPMRIFDWSSSYAQQYYDMVGITDLVSNEEINYIWDAQVATYKPKSENVIYIFKRKILPVASLQR